MLVSSVLLLVAFEVNAAKGPAQPVPPQPGDLDSSFGAAGRVTTEFGGILDDAVVRSVLVQPNGKIVAVGYGVGPTGFDSDFALARYNSDGSLDTSFTLKKGGDPLDPKTQPFDDGIVTTEFGNDDQAWAAVLQPDGKIVAAGTGIGGPFQSPQGFYLARYKTNGVLDSLFADNGRFIAAVPGWGARALLLRPDGRLIAAGHTGDLSGDFDFALIALLRDGSLDPSFSQGIVTTEFIVGRDNIANAIARQSDGKILVAGYTTTCCSGRDFAVARYNPDGLIDGTFGPDGKGKIATDISGFDDEALTVAVQADGKILVGGPMGNDFGLVRYTSNGTLDPSFGIGGIVRTETEGGSAELHALQVQSDGKILAAGSAHDSFDRDFVLVRYNTNGTLDPSFSPKGQDGVTVTTFVSPFNDPVSRDEGWALAVQSDGKIVVAGEARPHNARFALARYLADPPPARTLHAHLRGEASIPAVSSRGQGQANFHLNNDGTELTYRVNLDKLGPVSSIGIFESDFEEVTPNARLRPVMANLCSSRAGVGECDGSVRDPAFIESLVTLARQGRATILVMTEEHPDGELRGTLEAEPR